MTDVKLGLGIMVFSFWHSLAWALDTPSLKVLAHCTAANASWDKIPGATGYELWYKPIDQHLDWQHTLVDANATEFAANLSDDAHFYVSLLALRADERSAFAPTQALHTGNFLLPPRQKITQDGFKATLSWNAIPSAEYYDLWYTFDLGANWQKTRLNSAQQSLSVDLWYGAFVRTALQSIDAQGQVSRLSEIIDVVTGPPSVTSTFNNPLQNTSIVPVFPAVARSKYSAVTQDCVYSRERRESCQLQRLPLLGQEVANPTVDDIMARTLVSHTWMSERFRQFLQLLPTEALKLFRAVTAVVIASDIRPALYQSTTGAIYLDANNLLLQSDTQETVATVSTTPDFRVGCADSLSYKHLFRYVKQNLPAYHADINSRTLEDVLYLTGRVVMHELAHANDVFPPATLSSLDQNYSVQAAAEMNITQRISFQLRQHFALLADVLKYQGDVRFACTSATCQQTSMSAQQIAEAFAPDTANDLYGFSNVQEDLAMLAEETMMLYFLGAERDLAFADRDFIVQWGQRRRIAAPQLLAKTKFIMRNLLPEVDFARYLEGLAPPVAMFAGKSWSDNLILTPTTKSRNAGLLVPDRVEQFIDYQ